MKILVSAKIVGKSRSWSTIRKISILVNIFGKIDLGQNFPQILVLV